jgi:hypothetical protein
VFLVCNFLADREQKWLFLFLVCKFLADQEHLGVYAGAKNGNCHVAGQHMQHPSSSTTQAQAPPKHRHHPSTSATQAQAAPKHKRHPSTGTTPAQAHTPPNHPQQLSNRQSKDYRKENRENPPILSPGKC